MKLYENPESLSTLERAETYLKGVKLFHELMMIITTKASTSSREKSKTRNFDIYDTMELTRKSSDGALHFTFRSGGVAENIEMRREIQLCMSFNDRDDERFRMFFYNVQMKFTSSS